ncbi:MAG TPA: alpha/beta hydrolase, partial [Patescibacteria group bacterium]
MKKKIFILHGWTYETKKWEDLVKLLEKKFEVTLLKIPGLTAPLKEVWELDNYIQWFKEILDKEKEKVILLGHSNGGRISLAFALEHPEKVASLILIDSAGIYHNEFPLRIKRVIFRSIARIGRKLHNSERFRFWLYRLARENDYRKADPLTRKTMANLIKVDLSPFLAKISMPTIIIWGENDKITLLADGLKMQELIPHAKLSIVKNARHSPQFTHTKEVA